MKTQIFLLIVMALAWAGCQQLAPKNSDVEEAELTVCLFDDIKDTETIPLSKFVGNCTLVQFENTEEAHITPQCITVTDKYIGVRQQGALPYMLFDRSGKFLCSINWWGQSQSENFSAHSYLRDDIIDDKNDLIYLINSRNDKIMIYKTGGKLAKNITVPQSLYSPVLHLSDGNVLSIVHNAINFASKTNKPIAFQFDANDGKLIKKLDAPESLLYTPTPDSDARILSTRNTPAFDFHNTMNDTLFHYNVEKNKLEPVFTIDFDTHKKPIIQYWELPNHYITNFFEIKEKATSIPVDGDTIKGYFITSLPDKNLVCTDKRTGKSSYIKVVHDELGNMEVPAFSGNFRNGYYVYTLHPKRLIDNIEKRLQESDCTGQDKEKLNALLSKLDENANNVAFIGKLKQ